MPEIHQCVQSPLRSILAAGSGSVGQRRTVEFLNLWTGTEYSVRVLSTGAGRFCRDPWLGATDTTRLTWANQALIRAIFPRYLSRFPILLCPQLVTDSPWSHRRIRLSAPARRREPRAISAATLALEKFPGQGPGRAFGTRRSRRHRRSRRSLGSPCDGKEMDLADARGKEFGGI